MRVTNRATRILSLAAITLAGCATGHDGDVSIGGGQSPDPVVLDIPVAYVRGPLPEDLTDLEDLDVREFETFSAGADVWLRDRAAPDVPETNITERVTGGLWDVRDIDASYDGTKIVFAMRMALIPGLMDSEQPTWNLWEYDLPSDTLRRVILSDIVAEEGHDIAPRYLPDGRIVFSSSRQRQSKAVLIDEGKPQFSAEDEDRNEHAFVLHVMNPDGSGIRQISFNQSHDLDPDVLDDGRIVFSRWENASGSSIHLYTVNPDGSGLELLYGANSHATGTGGPVTAPATTPGATEVQFLQPRPDEDGRVVALLKPFQGTDHGADPVTIDTAAFVEIGQANLANAGLQGPAQERLAISDVRTDPGLSPGGRYSSVFPLRDGTGRLLTTWTMCRLNDDAGRTLPCTAANLADAALVPAPPLYGVWLYDPRDRTQRPVLQPVEGIRYTEVISLSPRAVLPATILDAVPGIDYDAVLASENVGILNIRSVYDFDGADLAPGGYASLIDPVQTTADERPARFVRVEKAVGLPDDEVRDFRGSAFGVAGNVMREILGYAPVEPDGSVRIKVPAGVPFGVTILDVNGRRTSPRHLNWLQLRAGEVLTCNGCHIPAGAQPGGLPAISHGRRELFVAVNGGATTTGQPFPNSNPAIFADQGETMGEARARVSCQTDCAALLPSVDMVYDDVWTDPIASGRAADAPFAYRYAQLTTPAPTSATCQSAWSSLCRITIHYPDHIHPLWSAPRQVLDAMGALVQDNTCTSCHTPTDAMGALRVPASQLDLSGGPSPDEADHLVSYRELLFGDNAQELDMGALQDILVPGPPDPVTGEPTLVPVPVASSMSGGGARASVTFFSRFDVGGTHAGWLTTAELRLIAEWLDIGGQYYNDPFVAPIN